MQISKTTSQTIDFLRFPLIIGIVFLHNGSAVAFGDKTIGVDNSVICFYIRMIIKTLSETAVPLFFIISGFLFFYNFEMSFQCYKRKLASRTKTLIIPYLFWNAFYFLFVLSLQSIPALSHFFNTNNKPLIQYNLFDYFDAFTGFIGSNPIAYQFWFIRDLIIMSFLSPLFYFCVKRFKFPAFLVFFCLWYFDLFDFHFIRNNSLFFFFCGCIITTMDFKTNIFNKFGNYIVAAFIVLFTLFILGNYYNCKPPHIFCLSNNCIKLIFKVVLLVQLAAFWIISINLKTTTFYSMFLRLSQYSFFVFAAHEPTLSVIRKLSYRFLPKLDGISGLIQSITYIFLIPGITIITVLFIGYIIKMAAPKPYAFVTGGRGK
jgi:surface polysaccharide O-acyltransferase-like enzyme